MTNKNNTKLVLVSWIVMLAVSSLPNIILDKLNIILSWLPYAKMLVLLILFVISFFYNEIFSLREYFGVFLAVFMTRELIIMVRAKERWRNWFGGNSPSFIQFKIREQLLLIVAVFIIYFVLLAIKKKPALFFLSMGDINARVKPVKWLAVKENTYWQRFGVEIGIYLTLGILLYLLSIQAIPSIRELMLALKYIPVIIIFASINSFYEELLYRASLLSVLEDIIGGKHALYLTSLYFGIGHYFGVPSGIIGILLSSFLGYILGKSMLETRGFFWAFSLHFLMDFWIYIFASLSFN